MAKKEIVKNKKNYKSIQIGLISALGIVLIVLSAFIVKDKIDERKKQNELMESFYEYFERDELTLIFYTSAKCSYCQMQTPILENIASIYEIDYLAVDYNDISSNQQKEVLKKLGIDGATPTTVIVKNGEVKAVQKGYLEGNKYVEFLIKASLLDEGSTYVPEENLTFIDYDKFENIRGESKPTILVLGASACTYCASAKPILSNLAKAYDIQINYLTIDYITKEERLAVVDALVEMGYKEETFVKENKITTPSVLIVQEDKVIAYEIGLQNVTIYTKLFKGNGVISE